MIKYSKNGLSLLGVIIAVGIALIGLVGIVGLLRFVLLTGRLSSDRFIATNLAEEGIEIVRSYRDSNWKSFISVYIDATFPYVSETKKIVDYTKNDLVDYVDTFLNKNAAGFYTYAAGTQTKFKRTIILDPNKCQVEATDLGQCISVVSKVTWDNYTLIVEDWLYNWKP